jgi:SpoU rRNA methylase family enzyme
MEDKQPVQERKMINTKSLSDLAIYLSGVKEGKGNLLPLGTIVLDDLWDAVKYLQGDVRFISERDSK